MPEDQRQSPAFQFVRWLKTTHPLDLVDILRGLELDSVDLFDAYADDALNNINEDVRLRKAFIDPEAGGHWDILGPVDDRQLVRGFEVLVIVHGLVQRARLAAIKPQIVES